MLDIRAEYYNKVLNLINSYFSNLLKNKNYQQKEKFMKKPKLEDFNLDSKSAEVFKEQEEKYNQNLARFYLLRNERNKVVNWVAYLPMTIFLLLFLIFTYKLNNFGEGSELACILLLVLSIVYPILIKKIFYIEEYALSDFQKKQGKKLY